MTDPLVLNAAMPSEEYARYAAFWTGAIRACFVFVTGTVLMLLLLVSLMASRLLNAIQQLEQTIQHQTDVMTGGRSAD